MHLEAELYSPEGNCQYRLAPIPLELLHDSIVALVDDKILACGGYQNRNCYQYLPNSDSWSFFSTGNFYHFGLPGRVFNNKLYIVADANPEVLDPATNTWSSWPTPLKKTDLGPCLVPWKDTFILLGGRINKNGIQMFNHSTNTWQIIESSSVPMDMAFSACTLLPNDQILVSGSDYDVSDAFASLYNIAANSWQELPDASSHRRANSLITLGTRVFDIRSSEENFTMEFHYKNNTWSQVEGQLIYPRLYYAAIAVPAEMFQHLPGGCVGVQ